MRGRDFSNAISIVLGLLIALCGARTGNAADGYATSTQGWNAGASGYATDPAAACQDVMPLFTPYGWKSLKRIEPGSAGPPSWNCVMEFQDHNDYPAATAIFSCHSGYYASFPGICAKLPETSRPPQACPIGHAIEVTTGSEFLEATDYTTSGQDPLAIKRTFRGRFGFGSGARTSLGTGWSMAFDRFLSWTGFGGASGTTTVTITTGDGSPYTFNYDGTVWTPSPADSGVGLTRTTSGSVVTFDFRDTDDRVDHFELVSGTYKMTSSTWRSGYRWTFAYNGSGQVTTITDSFARQLTLTWTGSVVSSITAPGSVKVTYGYQSFYVNTVSGPLLVPGGEVLASVTVSKTDGSQAETTTYLHEDPDIRYFVTGVTDARGVRYATYAYDSQGRMRSESLSGGVEPFTYLYDDVNYKTTVTNPLGRQTVYTSSLLQSRLKVSTVSGLTSTNCPATSAAQSYDTSGYVSQKTDAEGRITNYVNNARGLPTSITEAYGTAAQRVTTVTWDSVLHQPTQIVAPGRTVNLTYDTTGRLTQRSETDTTSQSTPYSTNGQTRSWAYTYSTQGLLLTVNGPLSGTGDTVTYTYDANGFLSTVTDELGHVTQITSVNGRGQPLTILDMNGVETDLAYDAHGRLTSITRVPGANQAVTSLTYDAIGEITQISLPTGGTLSYSYSNARRLTAVQDSAGNRIEYAYDTAGNVTGRTVKDPGSTMLRQRPRPMTS